MRSEIERIEIMTKEKLENKQNTYTFTLPISGKTVEMADVKKADGHMLMKVRKLADDAANAGVYIMAELCKIDGEKVTADDILDLDLEDVVAIENEYIEQKKKLTLTQKT